MLSSYCPPTGFQPPFLDSYSPSTPVCVRSDCYQPGPVRTINYNFQSLPTELNSSIIHNERVVSSDFSLEPASRLTTISTRVKSKKAGGKRQIQVYPDVGTTVNLSARWAMQHPEILNDFHMRNNRDTRRSMKLKTLRSKTEKFVAREKREPKSHRKPTTSLPIPAPPRPKTPDLELFTPISSPSPSEKTPSPIIPSPKMPSPKMPSPKVPSPKMPWTKMSSPKEHSPVKLPVMKNVKSFLPPTSGEKVDKYENVVGELKAAISKYGEKEEDQVYVKPSAIARSLNRKIPPLIPPPPKEEPIEPPTFTKSWLRHVTPPATPQLGRALDSSRQPPNQDSRLPWQKNSERNIKQVAFDGPTDGGYPISASSHEKFPFTKQQYKMTTPGSYETDILKYLPYDIGSDGKSKYLASDGTEWDVIVVKPEEDELAVLSKLLKQENSTSAQYPAQIEQMSDVLKQAKTEDLNEVKLT